jgi:monoamine oxidase
VATEFLPILNQPFGLVHWAGTETATYWNGYMDGAVRSGERAAQEALAHL